MLRQGGIVALRSGRVGSRGGAWRLFIDLRKPAGRRDAGRTALWATRVDDSGLLENLETQLNNCGSSHSSQG